MVKLIIFDLDGVLVEAKNVHFDALNKALDAKTQINLLKIKTFQVLISLFNHIPPAFLHCFINKNTCRSRHSLLWRYS